MRVNGLAVAAATVPSTQLAADGFALLCKLVLAGSRDVFLCDGKVACFQIDGEPVMLKGTETKHGILYEFID